MKRFDKKEIDAVIQVIQNGKYLSGFTTKFHGGEHVQKFEEEFARFIGVKHAISMNSGTTALFVAFKTAIEYGKKKHNSKLKSGEIHMPAYTFTADPSAALLAGGKITFHDIDEKTFCMKRPQHSVPIAVPTHLLGNAVPNIESYNSQFLIEDCCQALGTQINGKHVGTFGHMSVFSFQETKHMTTLGEGGMLCSNNGELIEIAAAIRNHAEYYLEKEYLGSNFRMTEVQAAFGRVQLRKMPAILQMFRKNAQYIMKKLPYGILPPYIPPKVKHSFLMLGCTYDAKAIGVDRKTFLDRLTHNRRHILLDDEKSDIKGINMKSGKLVSTGYSKPLYEIPYYRKFKPKHGCPTTVDIIDKSIWMDIHRFRSKSEISEELDILHNTVREFQR